MFYTYKVLNGAAPAYLSDIIEYIRTNEGALDRILRMSKTRIAMYRSKSLRAPTASLWNELPAQKCYVCVFIYLSIFKSNIAVCNHCMCKAR